MDRVNGQSFPHYMPNPNKSLSISKIALIVFEIGLSLHVSAVCNTVFIYCNLWIKSSFPGSEVPQLWLRPFPEEGHVYCTHAKGLGDERMPLTVKLPDFYQGAERGTAVHNSSS